MDETNVYTINELTEHTWSKLSVGLVTIPEVCPVHN